MVKVFNQKLFSLSLVILFLSLSSPLEVEGRSAIQITNNNIKDRNPFVSNGQVFWDAWYRRDDHLSTEIMLFNGISPVQLTNNNFSDQISDADNGQIVWTQAPSSNSDAEVFLYTGTTTVQLSRGNAGGSPQISNGQVAWSFLSANILFFDGTRNYPLYPEPHCCDIGHPGIDQGKIVWHVRNFNRPDEDFLGFTDIFLFDGSSIRVISDTLPRINDREPKIHNNQVVWIGHDGRDYEVFLFDGQKTLRLTDNLFDDLAPNIHNRQVVWQEFDGNDYEILLYDTETNTTRQLTNNTYHDGGPEIYDDKIVWQGEPSRIPQVFFYDGGTVTQLTTSPFHGSFAPRIDKDLIVWTGWDGSDFEIYLYRIPQEFWSEVKNAPVVGLLLRKTPGTQNKAPDDVLKTVPNGWVVKVLSTTDDSGKNVDADNYRWFQISDVTDGVVSWMPAISLQDGTIFLENNSDAQSSLQRKAAEQMDTKEKRVPIVLEAVDQYYNNADTTNSLYGTRGGRDGGNDFQRFIAGTLFPKELILAIAAQESGGVGFDNEACSSAKDGGIGIMQITSVDFKGKGSGLDNYPRKNDCDARSGWTGTLSKYYSNAIQGIHANIKDGFRALQEKYRKKCSQESITIEGIIFSCQDIEKVLTVWGYNGFARNPITGELTGNYLKDIADKLMRLAEYFTGVSYPNTDQLIEKLLVAHRHKQIIRLYSPAQLRIIDPQGSITGLVDTEVKEDIPNSLYEAEHEAAAIFFSEEPYHYRVVGTSKGTYGLTIDMTQDASTTAFTAADIPISSPIIHEYTIDWEALSRSEKGVTVKVDEEGDGTFDYQFQASQTLHDTTPPETQTELTGTHGNNSWFISDVLLTLKARDNEGGVGVRTTEYSLDGGVNWHLYTNPVLLSTDGIHSLQYRSRDFLGNLAKIKTVEIKIDKTPPEAALFFDPNTQTFTIEGTDNLTLQSLTRHQRFALIQDEAGNTLTVFLEEHSRDNKALTVEIRGLQYNTKPSEPARAELSYEWLLQKKENVLRSLKQKVEARRQFEIKAEYHRRDNTTEVEIRERKKEGQRLVLEGLIIVRLVTDNGQFRYELI